MNSILNKQVDVRHLGLIDYQAAWTEQERLFARITAQKLHNRSQPDAGQPTPNYLLFCEHPHVYTLGTSGSIDNLLVSEEELREQYGATFFKIRRGGDITYHGPGQLVGYPILDLENFFTDIHRYMRLLEESIILTLGEYGLRAGRIEGSGSDRLTGVWLDYDSSTSARTARPRKICALGVKASRWVTMHGFALNVNTDLSYFGHIVPCGIADKAVTSMAAELGYEVPMLDVANRVQAHLAELFEMEVMKRVETA